MRYIFLLLAAFLMAGYPPAGLAQQRPGAEGTLRLVGWPERSMAGYGATEKEIGRALAEHELLPSIDTLRVGYRYERREDEPGLSLALEWKPGAYGILDGKQVPYAEMPDSIVITSLALHADVYARGKQITEVVIRLDRLSLAPLPDVYSTYALHLDWRNLFVHTPPQAARRIFEEGFELRHLEILSATFESYDSGADATVAGRYETDRPRPSRRSVYVVDTVTDVFIDLSWLFRPPQWYVGAWTDDGGDSEPRGDEMGRKASGEGRDSGRGSERTSDGPSAEETGQNSGSERAQAKRGHGRTTGAAAKGAGDDSDDDDDSVLLPAALTAAAAVGVLAYAGGTIGYFGNAKTAPIGLSAGVVRPRGGFLLQAGVNEAVLSGQGEEHFLAKAFAFRQVLPGPIQPAAGAGVLVTYADQKYTYEPSLSLGAVGTFGPVVLMGAYDITLGGVELSVAFNLRTRGTEAGMP